VQKDSIFFEDGNKYSDSWRLKKTKLQEVFVVKKLFIVTLVLVMVFSITGMASNSYKISVVLKALNSDYWKTVEAGAKDAANELGVEVSVIGPSAETQVMEQFNMLQDQLIRDRDALVVAPLRPTTLTPIFEQAKQTGIPVLLIDTDAPWEGKVTFIGTGNYEAGRQAGEYMLQQLPNGGNIVLIRGAMGDLTHDERTNGFLDAVEGTNIKVVAIQPANSERGMGMNVMQNLLQAQPDIDGVYATNDEMALGALRAIQTAGIKKDMVIIGFDGTPDALKSIRDGGLTATIKQDSYMIGYYGVEYAVKYLNGEKVEKKIPVPTLVIDKTNVQEEIANMEKILGRNL